jgi:hypothetical protein
MDQAHGASGRTCESLRESLHKNQCKTFQGEGQIEHLRGIHPCAQDSVQLHRILCTRQTREKREEEECMASAGYRREFEDWKPHRAASCLTATVVNGEAHAEERGETVSLAR